MKFINNIFKSSFTYIVAFILLMNFVGFGSTIYNNLVNIFLGQWICSTESVPDGFVVTSYSSSPSCPSYSAVEFNTKYIQKPGNWCWICSNSPVPKGYVTEKYGSSPSCPSYSAVDNNTKLIVRVE